MSVWWSLRGELVLCPCTLSLGVAPPTEAYCQTWAGIRIDKGWFDDTDLTGIDAGLIIDIPGVMSRGNWTAGLFIDDNAPHQAAKALTRIFTAAPAARPICSRTWSGISSAYRTRRSFAAPRLRRASSRTLTPQPRRPSARKRANR